MDNLAKCAFLAMQNRMSYGKYMATFKPPKPPKPKVKKEPEQEKQDEKLCLECGGGRWCRRRAFAHRNSAVSLAAGNGKQGTKIGKPIFRVYCECLQKVKERYGLGG